MAQVFRAVQEPLGRDVALKVLHPHLTDPEVRQRFLLEAKAVASLKHDNIVQIYDFDQADGQAYIAMACLQDGVSGGCKRPPGKSFSSSPKPGPSTPLSCRRAKPISSKSRPTTVHFNFISTISPYWLTLCPTTPFPQAASVSIQLPLAP
jgi:hypothetical protein